MSSEEEDQRGDLYSHSRQACIACKSNVKIKKIQTDLSRATNEEIKM